MVFIRFMCHYHKDLYQLICQYGNDDSQIFQKVIDEFLMSIKNQMTRNEVYQIILGLPNDKLSESNSDYLCDVISDIRGHTGNIYYRFEDDPDLDNISLLAYVRMGLWKNSHSL